LNSIVEQYIIAKSCSHSGRHVGDKSVRYWSKIVIVHTPPAFDASVRGGRGCTRRNIAIKFDRQNYTVSQKTCDHIFGDKLN